MLFLWEDLNFAIHVSNGVDEKHIIIYTNYIDKKYFFVCLRRILLHPTNKSAEFHFLNFNKKYDRNN